MFVSIRKVFFNLKNVFLALGAGVTLLMLHLFHISEYTERLSALKNQHLLIEKIINTDLTDPQMASILINASIAEISLAVKLSGQEALFDAFLNSNEEQASLLRSLEVSSKSFQEYALGWAQSRAEQREASQARMMSARSAYLSDIDRMLDYQVHITSESVATAKMSAIVIFLMGLVAFLFYRFRLNQIYHDIHTACSVDIDGSRHTPKTHEIDFILKQMARKPQQTASSPNLTHPMSGLNNEKGMFTAFNAKKADRAGNNVFLCLFEIDGFEALEAVHTQTDLGNVFQKIGEIISFYEQPLDVIAHTDDNHIVFIMSRNSKKAALEECEHIVRSVQESAFPTAKGIIRITISGGFLLKTPIKSLEEVMDDARKLITLAQENGGSRVAQLRESTNGYR